MKASQFFHDSKERENNPLVLVAGGAGFVGSFLCELLLQQNCRVICVDDLLTGSKKNLENCLKNPDFLFLEKSSVKDLPAAVNSLDYLFHLAGQEAFITGEDKSLSTLLTNIGGTLSLLKLAEKTGAKFLLASSPQVFQAKIALQQLNRYFGQGEMAEVASFAEAKRSAEALTSEYANEHQIDARIVRLDWVYGPRMDLKTSGELTKMLGQAVKEGIISLPGDGSKKIRPTFVGDVVYGLSKAMFSPGTSGKIYNLINPQAISLLSLAQKFQAIFSQDLKIKFVAKENADQGIELPSGSPDNLNWQPKVGIEEGLKQTVEYFAQKGKRKKEKKKTNQEKTAVRQKKKTVLLSKKFLFLSSLSILALILFFPAILIFNTLFGTFHLKTAYQTALAGNFYQAVSSAGAAEKDFQRAQNNLQTLVPLFALLKQENVKNQVEVYLVVGHQAGRGLEKLGEIGQNVSQMSQAIFQKETIDFVQLSSTIATDLDLVYEHFSYLEAVLKSKPDWPNFLVKLDQPLIEELPLLRELVLQAKKSVVLLPDLTGVYQRKTYLVLFQNNMELRATGGFIGSLALVTFEGGRLIDFHVTDVYSADGQLKGHVEPPEEIKEFLGEAGWYLRDSNFHPDFPISARRAAWFLEKETGKKVDGVIGIDLFLAQRILQVLGPVDLPDYQEKIDADNLFERAEYHAEVNFFPGSTQKKDFLGAVANALFEKIKQAEEGQWLGLSQMIYQSLKAKDLLVYLNHQEAARILADLGWDGGLRQLVCQDTEGSCLADYLMIVESNFGINKANYFVKRDLTHQIDFGPEGEVRKTLKINYHNQSQSEIFPAGVYKNYLRILTPLGSQLEKVTLDGQAVAKEKIKISQENDKTVFGFLVEVPILTKKSVEVRYQLAEKWQLNEDKHYLLYLQKQPGIEDQIFNLWFAPPKNSLVKTTLPVSSRTNGMLVFTPQFNQDQVFEIVF